MLEPVSNPPSRGEWGERDWERFLQRADARAAKFRELFETLVDHPERDRIIADEMGWKKAFQSCGGVKECAGCSERVNCEAYDMLCLVSDPAGMEDDPATQDLLACFEELQGVPAYVHAQEFAAHIEDVLRERAPHLPGDNDVNNTLFAAQMVPAQIAGGHGIGYDRDSLCGNIANCKRALKSMAICLDHLAELQRRHVLSSDETASLRDEAENVRRVTERRIGNLRAQIWWR